MTYQNNLQNYLNGYLKNNLAEALYAPKNPLVKDLESRIKTFSGEDRGFVDSIFSDRIKANKTTVTENLAQIDLSQKLHNELIYRIDNDICRCHNYASQIELVAGNSYGQPNGFEREKASLKTQAFNFEQEKRKEDLEFWTDMMMIKKYLIFAFKDYWLAARKAQILGQGAENEQTV